MATTQQPRTDFVKALSRLDATALVVGSMIGSGIFIVSADILRQVHAPGVLLLVWGLSPQRILAILSVIVLTWINVRGVKTAAVIQTSLTAIKTTALAALILLGIMIGRNAAAIDANFGPAFWPAGGLAAALWPVIGAAMVGSLFSMDAWNNVGFAGSELKDAKRDLPIAMAAGTLIVTVLYLLANVSYLNVLPAEAIAHAPQDRVGTAALQAMFGNAGLYLMAGAIMISTFGCNNGLILSGARVYYAMAQDNLFFRSIGVLHPGHKTPAVALVVQAVWTSLLCLSGTYSELLNYVIFAALLFYMLTAVGLFFLRARRRQRRERGAHRGLGGPPFHVQIEEVLPRRRAVGTALELREVEPGVGERGERARQRPGTVRQLEAERGLSRDVRGRWRRVARHQQKPGLVVRLVLDPFREHLQTVAARREHSRHGAERRVLAPGDLRRRARGIVERDDLDP